MRLSTQKVILPLALLLAIATAWLLYQYTVLSNYQQRNVTIDAETVDGELKSAVQSLEMGLTELSGGENRSAAGFLFTTEMDLRAAEQASHRYGLSADMADPLSPTLRIYRRAVQEYRQVLETQGALNDDQEAFLHDALADLHAIHGAVPSEVLSRANSGEIRERLRGLRETIRVENARITLG